MIRIENLSKIYETHAGPKVVFKDVNLTIRPGEKWGFLGRNGAGKSTLVRLISGAERPSGGRIIRGMSVSWPLAFGGAFHGALTGRDNLRFVCRIYQADIEKATKFAEAFAELGPYFDEQVKKYSSGMRSRLAFSLSMAVDFDCFLIDEIVAVGDSRFHQKCEVELFERRAAKTMIIVSHDIHYIKQHCTHAAVVGGGRIEVYDDVEAAVERYLDSQNQTAEMG
ncbi:ABC transporter ATP-binding protein [Acidocella facilis]|nr:ABC transporter ATP-binding protein [Acidocella facilis]